MLERLPITQEALSLSRKRESGALTRVAGIPTATRKTNYADLRWAPSNLEKRLNRFVPSLSAAVG